MTTPPPSATIRPLAIGLAILLLSAAHAVPGTIASVPAVEVLYAPEDEPLTHVVELYDRAARYVYVAVYGLTSPLAVKSLVEARKRGIDVRIITDRERATDEKQQVALSTLRMAGIPIKVNRHDSLMHLKQVVIDDEVNTNGSMNHTTSGNRYNDERLDVIRDRAISIKAREKFLSMWKDEERFEEWK